jgi:hypothetical protein
MFSVNKRNLLPLFQNHRSSSLIFISFFLVAVFPLHFTTPVFPPWFPAVFPLFSRYFPAVSPLFSRCFPAVFPPFFLPESVQSAVDTWFLAQQASSSLHLENERKKEILFIFFSHNHTRVGNVFRTT